MALAYWTFVKELRPMLISQGITWENSKAKESGIISPIAEALNRKVFSIMHAANEELDLPPAKTFFEARGLA